MLTVATIMRSGKVGMRDRRDSVTSSGRFSLRLIGLLTVRQALLILRSFEKSAWCKRPIAVQPTRFENRLILGEQGRETDMEFPLFTIEKDRLSASPEQPSHFRFSLVSH